MYSYNQRPALDTPPPTSNIRRPWSPDPYDPYPSTRTPHNHYAHDDYFDNTMQSSHQSQNPDHSWRREREASDVSVEALDLADYRHALHSGRRDQYGPRVPQPPRAFHAYDAYPPSPKRIRPLATGNTVDSFGSVPSMTSGPSSNTHHTSSYGHAPPPRHRPFSLPASAPTRSYPDVYEPETSHTGNLGYGYSGAPSAYRHGHRQEQETEVDLGQIPQWSQGWFAPKAVPAASSSRSSLPPSQRPLKQNVFDPDYTGHLSDDFSPYSPQQHDPYAPVPYQSVHSHSSRHDGALPWGGSASRLGPPVDDAMKEERIRMLEREFAGPNNTGTGEEDETELLIGGVDQKGRLVTVGPKKRTFVRFMQGALALCAAITSIYAAVLIKPTLPPPPRDTPQAYLLYVLSTITTLVVVYLFLIQPCCSGSRKTRETSAPHLRNGMMVLPVQHLPGGAQAKKKDKKGKKGTPHPGGDVQVNLIVDPTMFGGDRDKDEPESDDEGTERSWAPNGKKKPRNPKRRSVFEGLAMEAQWKAARSTLKRRMAFDMVAGLIWAAGFVYILTGQRCPINGFQGWCNAYNVATAASCFIAFAFGLSVFFDIKDLHSSRQSPRTRT